MSLPTTAASLGSLLADGAAGAGGASPARARMAQLEGSRGRIEALLALVDPPALVLGSLLDPLAASSLRSATAAPGDAETAPAHRPIARSPGVRQPTGGRPAAPLAVAAARLGALPARPTAPGPFAPIRPPAVTPRDGVRPAYAAAALHSHRARAEGPAPGAPANAAAARVPNPAADVAGTTAEPSLARALERLTTSARVQAPVPAPPRRAATEPASPLRRRGAATRAVSRALADPAAVCAPSRARGAGAPDRGAVADPPGRPPLRASEPPAASVATGKAGSAAAPAPGPTAAPNATLAAVLARVSASAATSAAAARAATSPAFAPATQARLAEPAPQALAVERLARTVASLDAVHGRLDALAHTAPEPVEWLDDDDALAGRLERLLTRQAQARGIDLS